jgi:6-phosphogluconolactonase (cycloisomerase 2 family)
MNRPYRALLVALLSATTAESQVLRFAYVSNEQSNDLSAYSVNVTTGVLTPRGSFAAGMRPTRAVTDPVGEYVYVASTGSDQVHAFRIDFSSGGLIPVPGSPFATGNGPTGVTVSPSGEFLYVTNARSSTLSGFRINPVHGSLTPLDGFPFATGPGPRRGAGRQDEPAPLVLLLSQTQDRLFGYVPAGGAGTESLWGYRFDPIGGGVIGSVPGSPAALGAKPTKLAIVRNSRDFTTFAYSASAETSTIHGFALALTDAAATGALSAVPGSPVATGNEPRALAGYSTAPFLGDVPALYAVNAGSNTLQRYSVNSATGQLDPALFTAQPVGERPVALATDGTYTYVANELSDDMSVYVFSRQIPARTFTQMPGSPFAAGTRPREVVLSSGSGINPHALYVANYDSGNVSGFAVDSSDRPTPMDPPTFPAGSGPRFITLGQVRQRPRPIVGSWTGTGSDDVGTHRGKAEWHLRNTAQVFFPFGDVTDRPVAGDWDGNGTDTIGVFRNGAWYLRNANSLGAPDYVFGFGAPGDLPVVGDGNGDGRDDVGAVRPAGPDLVWHVRFGLDGGPPDRVFSFGLATDVPLLADMDGDGRVGPVLVRDTPLGLLWLYRHTLDSGPPDGAVYYGAKGDGVDTVGVARRSVNPQLPESFDFYLRNSNTAGPADVWIIW